jgi:hypothetical protein
MLQERGNVRFDSLTQDISVTNFCIDGQVMRDDWPKTDTIADRCTKTHVIEHYMLAMLFDVSGAHQHNFISI